MLFSPSLCPTVACSVCLNTFRQLTDGDFDVERDRQSRHDNGWGLG